jgi:hypothetical protein
MKKYELQYTKGEDGVFCMSLVENPATKTQLVMFDDESKLLQFQDDDKQIVYSVAMRPNMLIPRKDINGEPAMVFATGMGIGVDWIAICSAKSLPRSPFKCPASIAVNGLVTCEDRESISPIATLVKSSVLSYFAETR